MDQGDSGGQIALGIEGSSEYQAKLVQDAYGSFLQRPAEPAAQQWALQFLAAGGSVEQLDAAILGSPEYYAKHGSTTTGFVTGLYQDLLGKPPGDVAASAANDPSQDERTILAESIVKSAEGVGYRVQGFYQRFLHRAAEDAGLHFWQDLLTQGASSQQVIAGFVGSAEYSSLLNPAITAALPRQATITLAQRAGLPTDAQELSWQFSGDVTGMETLIQLREPGNVYPVGGSFDVRPGSLPATGDVVYLKSDGTFSTTSTAYATGQASGQTTFHLPAGAKEGEWEAVVLLHDPATGQFVSANASSFLVSSKPAIFLNVNRTLANSDDTIHAELLTGAGQTPQNVRVLATLLRPDGTEVSLPDRTSELRFVYEGQSSDASYELYNGSLGATGVGNYLLRVRLLDAATGNILSLADAAITVSDTPGTLAGVVHNPDGTPVDGTHAKFAFVQAFDVDDGGVTAQSDVGADGSYSMTLDPGRYLISANDLDAQGEHRTADSTQLTVVGPDGANLALDLTLGAPVGPAIDPPGDPPPPASGRLPQPMVFVTLSGAGITQDTADILESLLSARIQRGSPGLEVLDKQQLGAALQLAALQQSTGADTNLDLTKLQQALGSEFIVAATVTRTKTVQHVAVTVLNQVTGDALRRVAVHTSDTTDGGLLDLMNNAAAQLNDGLGDAIRAARERPADPRVDVQVAKNQVQKNEPDTATVTLKDADGSPQANKPVKVDIKEPGQSAPMEEDATTDANGKAQVPVPDPASGEEEVKATYKRRDQNFSSDDKAVDVENPDEGLLRLTTPDIPAGSDLTGGEQVRVEVVVIGANGLLASGAGVDLEANNGGVLSTDHIVTDQNGGADFMITMPNREGEVDVDATYVRRDHPENLFRRLRLYVLAAGKEDLNTSAAANASGKPTVTDGGAADVFDDVTVSGNSDANAPVQFTVQGGGTLAQPGGQSNVAQTDTQTDSVGRANTVYVPPATGSGTATITATTTVDGQTYTKSLDIAYEPAPSNITVTPSPAQLFVGQTQQFNADAPVIWSATGGTIDNNGLFTAGSTQGNSFSVTATSQADATNKTQAGVTIIDPAGTYCSVNFEF
jgi:hypothetical protein